jgi:hypothetical protein
MAAGEGFKEWQTGDVLTANDVNGYLNQGIWVFDDAADRTAQVTSPQEGNFAYLRDDNKLYYYTGSAWAEADTSGIQPSEFAAKGDLLVGTGSSTFDNLGVGANGTVLTADSTETTGLKWVAPGGAGGKVLQVVMGTLTAQVNTTSTSFSDIGLSVNITPSSATSKILVLGAVNGVEKNSGNSGNTVLLRLMRDSTSIQNIGNRTGHTNTDVRNNVGSVALGYLDSPNTTSATTYKVQSATFVSGQFAAINAGNTGADTVVSTIVVLEIGA